MRIVYVLVAVTLAAVLNTSAALCADQDLSQYIDQSPWFEAVNQQMIDTLGEIKLESRPNGMASRSDDLELKMVGRSDFVYQLRAVSVEYQLAFVPATGKYCGLAETRCVIESDYLGGETGEVAIIWIGVDVPGVLTGSRSRKLGLDMEAGDSILVFGYVEYGYRVAWLDHSCAVDSNNDVVSYFGRPIVGGILWDTLSQRKKQYSKILSENKSAQVLVRAPGGHDTVFNEFGQVVTLDLIDGKTQAEIGKIRLRLGATKWAKAHKPVFEAGEYYLLFAAPDSAGAVTLENGKLDVALVRGGSVYDVTGSVLGDLSSFIRMD